MCVYIHIYTYMYIYRSQEGSGKPMESVLPVLLMKGVGIVKIMVCNTMVTPQRYHDLDNLCRRFPSIRCPISITGPRKSIQFEHPCHVGFGRLLQSCVAFAV